MNDKWDISLVEAILILCVGTLLGIVVVDLLWGIDSFLWCWGF